MADEEPRRFGPEEYAPWAVKKKYVPFFHVPKVVREAVSLETFASNTVSSLPSSIRVTVRQQPSQAMEAPSVTLAGS